MIVQLTQGYVAHVDRADYPLVMFFKWCVSRGHGRNLYAETRSCGRKFYMHRFLMGEPDGVEVDHRDRDGLNNRRKNLRLSDRSKNLANCGIRSDNTTGFKGVYFFGGTRKKKWCAKVVHRGKTHYAGYHATPAIAARHYNAKARELHGEFASFNNVTPRFP